MNTILSISLQVDINPQTGTPNSIVCTYIMQDPAGFTKGKQATLNSIDNALQQIQAIEGIQVS